MLSRIYGIYKLLWYMFRYGKRIKFKGFPRFERGARINLKKGNVRIGKGLTMKPNSYCAIIDDGKLTIGDHVQIGRNSIIICHDHITIMDCCAIAPNVAIYDHDHRFGFEGLKTGFNTATVVIEKNCWIGAGVIILRGTRIGEGSVIGAGCILKGDIPAHSLVTSNREMNIVSIEHR